MMEGAPVSLLAESPSFAAAWDGWHNDEAPHPGGGQGPLPLFDWMDESCSGVPAEGDLERVPCTALSPCRWQRPVTSAPEPDMAKIKSFELVDDDAGLEGRLRRLREHNESCIELMLRPLERRVAGLACSRQTADGRLAEVQAEVQGLQDALTLLSKRCDLSESRAQWWRAALEDRLQARLQDHREELLGVVAAGLSKAAMREDVVEVADMLKVELHRLPLMHSKGANDGSAEAAGQVQARAGAGDAVVGVLDDLQRVADLHGHNLADLSHRTQRSEDAVAETQSSLDDLRRELANLSTTVDERLSRHSAPPGGNNDAVEQQQQQWQQEQQQQQPSDLDGVIHGQGIRDQLAETESFVKQFSSEQREQAASIAALLESAMGRLTTVEEQQQSLCRRLDALGLCNLAQVPVDSELLQGKLTELGQRVSALEDSGNDLSLDTAAQLQVALGAIDDHVSGSSGLSSARGGSCTMTLPTRFCEMVSLADSLASDLHNARLISDGEMASLGHFSMHGEDQLAPPMAPGDHLE